MAGRDAWSWKIGESFSLSFLMKHCTFLAVWPFPNRSKLTPQDILGWVSYFDSNLLAHSSL